MTNRRNMVIVRNNLTGNRQHMDRDKAAEASHVEILDEDAYGPNGRLKFLIQKPKTNLSRRGQGEAASKPVQPKERPAPKPNNDNKKD